MNKFKSFFNNLPFRYKITLVCLYVGIIPIIVFSYFSFLQEKEFLTKMDYNTLHEKAVSESQHLDNDLNACLDALQLILWNNSVRYSLSKKYETNFEMYLTYRDIIDPLIQNIKVINQNITSITIYSDNMNPHGDILRPLSCIVETEWYQSIGYYNTIPTFYLSDDKQTIYLFCQFFYSHSRYKPVVCIQIDATNLLTPLERLYEDSFGVLIYDKESQNSFIEYHAPSLSSEEKLTLDHLYTVESDIDSKYMLETLNMPLCDWTFTLYRPSSAASIYATQKKTILLYIVLCNLFIIILISLLFSNIITKPLNALAMNMKEIENNNFIITLESNSLDEIGQLITSFSHMTKRLQHLINEVLASQIAQKEYELKALQAQINPHFLYNSLSLINSKAILCGQDSICQIAQHLSTFYRTTLNKGNNYTTVKEELDNITSYINIQTVMHPHLFDCVYHIDENVLNIVIPNLILQPLVENSILHGLMHKTTPGKGILTIEAYTEEQELYFRILDNGCGMEESCCQKILVSETGGYGVANVHHRIQLLYGNEYGLCYHSTVNAGTAVLLHAKIKIDN